MARVLGEAQLYFPMFEEMFDRYDIPYEMKYLAVVESALNPTAKSRVGAMGLWQFMYGTGKMYGLEVTSYVDDRMDPYKSTEAACKYLSYLYGLYDDWNLALAAYNSGPGNVNKAIRRSGGKRTYWEIRPWLPKETRGYVPAFIAVNYAMNHASDHNIYPEAPRYSYFECDTLLITRKLHFEQISAYTGITNEELEYLNPVYKMRTLPGMRTNILRLKKDHIGIFLANEDSIFTYEPPQPIVVEPEYEEIIYKVKSGDVLGVIAQRYHVSVNDLRSWNNIRGNTIYPGQKLVILQKSNGTVSSSTQSNQTPSPSSNYHMVRKGDTLWDIAKLYPGVTVEDLKRLNGNTDLNRLQPGQKIKIK